MFNLEDILQRYQVMPQEAAACAQTVQARYDANGLPYHNWQHVLHVRETAVELLAKHPCDGTTQDALFLAIGFHDVIYDPWGSDNEEKSAVWAREILSPFASLAALLPLVSTLILDTKTHQPQSIAGQIIVDADLAILGSDAEAYQHYTQSIGEEYAWVQAETYRHGRVQVLQRFLQRSEIFYTETGRARWEKQARHNLQQEINRLNNV